MEITAYILSAVIGFLIAAIDMKKKRITFLRSKLVEAYEYAGEIRKEADEMIQYSEETLKRASEKLGIPISNEMFFMMRMEAHAYFRSKGREHAEKVMGHTEVGRHNIKMLFGDKK